MPDFFKKQRPFSFTGNNRCKFTVYGGSAEEALLEHLRVCTKRAGHQLSFKEANDPSFFIMIAPEEFLRYFNSFEEAAKMAWGTVLKEAQKDEQFIFVMNDGNRFTAYGESEENVLMDHLIEKTKQVGHRLSFEEANDPDCIIMVRPRTLAFVFGSFEKAADKAWQRVCVSRLR